VTIFSRLTCIIPLPENLYLSTVFYGNLLSRSRFTANVKIANVAVPSRHAANLGPITRHATNFGDTRFFYFFLHLFILQAIYIVLQGSKIKDAICRIKYQITKNKWRGQDIVKL